MQISLIILLCFIIYLFKKKGTNSLLVPLYWFVFWFLISVINPIGLNYSSNTSFLFVFLSLLMLSVGALPSRKKMVVLSEAYNETQKGKLKKTSTLLLLVCGPIIFYLSLKALSLISTMPLYAYRRTVYSEPEMLMGIKELFPLFQLFIEGGLLLLLIISFQWFFQYKSKKLLAYVFIFSCLFSIIFLGRYSIYRFLILLLIFTFAYSDNIKSTIKIVLVSLLIGSILIAFSVFRSDGLFGIEQVFVKHVVGYHTFGFSLFEYYYNSAPEFVERTWGGGSVFGSFVYFLSKPFALIFEFNNYLQSPEYYFQDQFVNLGQYELSGDVVELNANAFYTIFTDLYRDFSWLGVLFFYPLGKLAAYLQDRLMLKDPIAIMGLMYISFIIVFMSMKNPFIRHEIIVPTFFIFYKVLTTRKNFRYV